MAVSLIEWNQNTNIKKIQDINLVFIFLKRYLACLILLSIIASSIFILFTSFFNARWFLECLIPALASSTNFSSIESNYGVSILAFSFSVASIFWFSSSIYSIQVRMFASRANKLSLSLAFSSMSVVRIWDWETKCHCWIIASFCWLSLLVNYFFL